MMRKLGQAVQLESLAKLENVQENVSSEVPDIQIYRTENKIFLVAKKDKNCPKNTQIGGFGTGAYVSTSDESSGVKWNVDSDKVLVQIDDSTIRSDASSISTMTLYKLLIVLEKTKRSTEHKLSYIDVARKSQTEHELDSFEVKVRTHMKYKLVRNP